MKNIVTIILIVISGSAIAQQYSGYIVDAVTHEPVPFVNIGIVHRSYGTVAQMDGSFSLTLSDRYTNDTLRISMIGYTTQNYIVKNFRMQFPDTVLRMEIEPAVQELDAVTIRPRDMKDVELGNDFNSPNIMAGFMSDSLGSEIGTVMKVKDKRTYYLQSAGVNIANCLYDSITFRLNFYGLSDGKPGALLTSQPIYATVKKGQRNIHIDLIPYDIIVTDDFVMSVEWILEMPDVKKAFQFCAGFIGNRIFYKQVSQDDWRTFPVGVGMYCVAEFER